MRDTIPQGAIQISYQFGKERGSYHIWRTPTGKWQWFAVGASGEEVTEQGALAAARVWIKDHTIKKEN